MEYTEPQYRISTDKSELDVGMIHRFLSQDSYWAKGIPLDLVTTCIDNSCCFGVYGDGKQVGFARVITDFATFAYLADVFILPAYRGKGLSKLLMKNIMSYPDLQGLRRWMLATADAHGLYRSFGWVAVEQPERLMVIVKENAYAAK